MNELTPDEHGILVDAIHDSATVIHKGQRMNQRITKLMLEAGKTISGDKHIDADFCEKFAELIVRECTKFGTDRGNMHEGLYRSWAIDYSQRIEKHFGIEE